MQGGNAVGKKTVLLAAALAVAGLCILLWPVVSGHRLQADISAAAQGFLEEAKKLYPELLADLQGYNQRIYTERQAGLADAAACEEPAVLLRDYGVEDEIIGVLEIPKMCIRDSAYDVRQTQGRPMKEVKLENDTREMESAMATLLNYACLLYTSFWGHGFRGCLRMPSCCMD